MKISLNKGSLKVNGNEVLTIVFTDGSVIRFPVEETNEIELESTGDENFAAALGSQNIAISGKNIVSPGNYIRCGGDFRIGDS